jgi:hypothetical protein
VVSGEHARQRTQPDCPAIRLRPEEAAVLISNIRCRSRDTQTGRKWVSPTVEFYVRNSRRNVLEIYIIIIINQV